MAIPNIVISIIPVNQIVIKNNGLVSTTFTISKCNDAGTDFTPYVPTDLVNYIITPGSQNQFTVTDDLYKIGLSDTVTPTTFYYYYFIADNNIKDCKRKLLKSNLCGTSSGCNTQADYKYLRDRIKFQDLENGLYYIYSNFINAQSITMLMVPTNQELLTKKDYLTQLLDMCSCSSGNCVACGNSFNSASPSSSGVSNCSCSH